MLKMTAKKCTIVRERKEREKKMNTRRGSEKEEAEGVSWCVSEVVTQALKTHTFGSYTQ